MGRSDLLVDGGQGRTIGGGPKVTRSQKPGPWDMYLDVPYYGVIIDAIRGYLGNVDMYECPNEEWPNEEWSWKWDGNIGVRLRHVHPFASDKACEWFFEAWNGTSAFITLGLPSAPPSVDQVLQAVMWVNLVPVGVQLVRGSDGDSYGILFPDGTLTGS